MTSFRRLGLPLACLAVFGLAEVLLNRHVHQYDEGAYPELTAPLAELPTEFGVAASPSNTEVWNGADHGDLKQLREHLPYKADDLLFRIYRFGKAGPQAQLYMVFSKTGEDRKHHPEICIRDVSGAPEELAARKQIALTADGTRGVQRFRFITGPSTRTTVYYWHYSFPPLPNAERDWLQTLHLQLRHPSPSLTVQIATIEPLARLEAIEQSFLRAVDGALLSRHLPPSALSGCDRLPIGLIRQ